MNTPYWLLILPMFTFLWGLKSECVIEENSRTFVPVCDLKKIFPTIVSPKVDNFRNLFRLSGTKVELLQGLDRENLITNQRCDANQLLNYNSQGQCVLILELSGIGPIFYQLSVVVADVNDNVPSFDRIHYNIKIPENSQSNLEIDLPQARDADRGRNGTVTYILQETSASNKFNLINPSIIGALDSPLKLKILRPFDREIDEEIELVLIARDLGNPSLSSSLILKIEITDVNDHAPEFNQSSYRYTIPESVVQGQTIGRVFAFDRDSSSRIRIMISPSTSSTIMDRFQVSSDGVISTKMALEFTSSTKDLRIPIIAVDGGVPALTATTTVFVHITDVNDNSPQIEVMSANSNNRLVMTENCPPITYIAKVTAYDKDFGVNGQVECKLDDNYLFYLEPIQNVDNRRHYKLVTAPLSVFDRETKDTYLLNIMCYDKGVPALTTTRQMPILVTDENDNPPIFPQNHLSVTISENKPIGTRLVTLKAMDKDTGMNALTKYKLTEEESSIYFIIDAYTGVITTRGILDRETLSTTSITATAYDNLLPVLRSNVTIHVTILDENDNYPIFDKDLSFHARENRDGYIGRIHAVDRDEGRNKEIEYFLLTPTDIFHVSKMGEITVPRKSNLDREKVDHYFLEVGARDRGQIPLTSSTTVEIIVDDINDNTPIFHLPHPGYLLNISITTSLGTKIFTADATDRDSGINQRILYSMRYQSYFVINSTEGGIFLNRSLSNDEDLPRKLIIFARDCGNPSLTATLTLLINYMNIRMTGSSQPNKHGERRTSSSKDFILSLGIGMVLLIFTFLISLATYFCVSIFIQKRRQWTGNMDKAPCKIRSRPSNSLCHCLSNQCDSDIPPEQRYEYKMPNTPLNSTMKRELQYPTRLNRHQKSSEDDPIYSYSEFTLRPAIDSSRSPLIYDQSAYLPQPTNPCRQYHTLGHGTHRPIYLSDSVPSNRPPETTNHIGMTFLTTQLSHPDIVNSNFSEQVNRILYDELSPSFVNNEHKLSIFSPPNYENEMLKYESDNNLSSAARQTHQTGVDTESSSRFAGYVVGSPCYTNSFV